MTLQSITREFRELPLGLLRAPSMPSRSVMDDQGLDDLTSSILAIGLQLPLIVARDGDVFEIVAGHRRFIACGRAGLVAVPCLVYPSKEDALFAVQLAENLFREDLSPTDQAIQFAELLESKCNGDVDTLANLLKLKRPFVENRLLLLSGDPLVFQALERGQVKIGVAHELNKVTEERMRRYFLDAAIRGGATESIVRGWVSQWKLETGQTAAPPASIVSQAPPAPVPETHYFTCGCCLGTNDVHTMQAVNFHSHCYLAIVKPFLDSLNGK